MANIIRFTPPLAAQGAGPRRAALIASFAQHRRSQDDVFWLKENAELLNILECTGADLRPQDLAPLASFYEGAGRHICFFRQYYRFILSICLDLEDLGIGGSQGEALARWVEAEGLVEAELSDLQRGEARRLLARRGIEPVQDGLEARLRGFISRPQTFALPNKKAAYELTHIVFYLSEYGRCDPGLSQGALASLEYAGILAFLDQNADLLAEICIALRYAGQQPPARWEAWLQEQAESFAVVEGGFDGSHDSYHEYFVCNWLMAASGRRAFAQPVPEGAIALCGGQGRSLLHSLSQAVFGAGRACADWEKFRPQLTAALSEAEQAVLSAAEASSSRFGSFFERFARTGIAEAP
ncbi:DUF6902 family protein [Roseobacteraceae bacterium NS-SX3]